MGYALLALEQTRTIVGLVRGRNGHNFRRNRGSHLGQGCASGTG